MPSNPPLIQESPCTDPSGQLDLLLVNAPLRDYRVHPRVNDYTLPVLGMAYIATYAATRGYRVGVLDAEAAGLPVDETIAVINQARPRWAGFNLLAPTYELTATIAAALNPGIRIMAGGHHAKAMPQRILTDPRMARCDALILGEAETRVVELLADHRSRADLPAVMWLDPVLHRPVTGGQPGTGHHLAPDINALPFVDRGYLAQDPYLADDGRFEANMVGARGCPYDCSFCGAAVSANPDVTIRVRDPLNIIDEMQQLRDRHAVRAFRFVDDLFLGAGRIIDRMTHAFEQAGIGRWAVWDATGRINVLDRRHEDQLDQLAACGLREVALGIESGSERVLSYIDKRITPDMVLSVVERLTRRGIGVKGYFILGFPGESRAELRQTVDLVHRLWEVTEHSDYGTFRASVFQFRPYPGTPEWGRLMADGRYTAEQLLDYAPVDLGADDAALRGRDEFNFSSGIQFGEATESEIHQHLAELAREQHARRRTTGSR
ncbi:B12-binding domain-containing radical SAM protein [Nonomuraea sp. MG754425]|uniref:B12-binding domain-containing radical SAM protein n=1 Tax=Nonomuraea sp. MG754425 TaxID=2570319 RepID=UPI001F1B775C|nr:radical SAM protein [Nonomuraea sp. MG754425]MCF6471511.1 B12-binding domain-containing radical SAM protein [Nonomuraea sp. MG754425]